MGNALIADLTETFREYTQTYLAQMGDSLAAADYDRVRAQAHRIKGSASQLGADAIAMICQEMERAAQARSAGQLSELYCHLNGLFTGVCEEMAAYSALHMAE